MTSTDIGSPRTRPRVTELPVRVEVDGSSFDVPASAAQERIWFASQVSAEAALYHIYDEVQLGRLIEPSRATATAQDVSGIAAAWATIVQRHESLRTTIHRQGDELIQRVHTTLHSAISLWDLAEVPPDGRLEVLRPMIEALLSTPLVLDTPPPWKLALARISDDDWRLIISIHHAVADGASLLTLRGELAELLAAADSARPVVLPEIPLQYADYSEWQRTGMAAELAELDTFWDGYLTGIPAVHRIPTDLPRPEDRTFAADDIAHRLSAEAGAAISRLAVERRCSEFMVLCSAFLAVLSGWSGSTDLVVGLPVTGRSQPELDRVVGMFVNMVVLRVDGGGDPTFDEFLDRTRNNIVEVLEHQQMPFQRLVHRHANRAGQAVPPLYQIGFNHLAMTQRTNISSAEDDLGCEIGFDESGRFGMRIEYNTALFAEQTARDLATDLADTLAAVCADPSIRLSQLSLRRRATGSASGSTVVPATPVPRPEPAQVVLSATEELVATTWQELLPPTGRTPVPDDEFFACGGHSLLALRVIARIREAAGVDLPIADFFADTTLRGIAAALERSLIAEIAALSEEQTRDVLAADADPLAGSDR